MILTNYNINTYKDYWKNAQLVPSKAEDKQLPILIDTLKNEIDTDKIETVLEVGCGYGRVAKGIINILPNITDYVGLDLNEKAIKNDFWSEMDNVYAYERDFEEWQIEDYYDLVISIETMSVIPDYNTAIQWMRKMISLSKKYVVSIDFTRGNDTITNTPPHDYDTYYRFNSNVLFPKEFKIPNNESIFVVRVR